MIKKIIITTALAFGLGIATSNAALAPNHLLNFKNVKTGLSSYCDGHNLVYIWLSIEDGISGSSSPAAALSVIPKGC